MRFAPTIVRVAKSGPKQLPDEIWEPVLKKLTKLVGDKKFTGKALAVACGVEPPSVSGWMRGKTRPTLANTIKLLRAIGENPKEHLGAMYVEDPWEEHAKKSGLDPENEHVRSVYEGLIAAAMERAAKALKHEPDETGERPVVKIRTT